VRLSIKLLEAIMVAGDFFDESIIKRATAQRDYLNERYMRTVNYETIRDRTVPSDLASQLAVSRPARASARKPEIKVTPSKANLASRATSAFTARKR
jgi:hypothetical protein